MKKKWNIFMTGIGVLTIAINTILVILYGFDMIVLDKTIVVLWGILAVVTFIELTIEHLSKYKETLVNKNN